MDGLCVSSSIRTARSDLLSGSFSAIFANRRAVGANEHPPEYCSTSLNNCTAGETPRRDYVWLAAECAKYCAGRLAK